MCLGSQVLRRKDQCPGEVQARIQEFRREGERESCRDLSWCHRGGLRADPADEEWWRWRGGHQHRQRRESTKDVQKPAVHLEAVC